MITLAITLIIITTVFLFSWLFVWAKIRLQKDSGVNDLACERLRLQNKQIELEITEIEIRIKARGHDLKKL